MDNLHEMGLEKLSSSELNTLGGYWRGQNGWNANRGGGWSLHEVGDFFRGIWDELAA